MSAKICDHGPYPNQKTALASAPYAIARESKNNPGQWWAYWPSSTDVTRRDEAVTRVQQSVEIVSMRADLMNHQFPPHRYSWGKYTPLRATTGLIAEGKVGKSTLILTQMLHGAAGKAFLGQNTTAGLYFYLSCEDDIEIVERRAQKIMRSFSEAERKLAHANFKIINGVGKGLHFVTYDRSDAQISETVNRIIEAARKAANGKPVVSVAVDTVSRINGGQENDNNVMAMVEAAGARIAQTLDCSCVLLHHVSKAVAREGIADAQSGRGGSAFGDNCRSVLRLMPLTWEMAKKLEGLSRTEVEHGDILKLVHAALNQDRRTDDVYIRRTVDGLLELIEATTKDEAKAANNELGALVAWFKRTDKSFTVTEAARTRRPEWTKMTRTDAMTFIEGAIGDGKLVRAEGANKGGALYVPSIETLGIASKTAIAVLSEEEWMT